MFTVNNDIRSQTAAVKSSLKFGFLVCFWFNLDWKGIFCALKTMSDASDSFEELDLDDQSRLNGIPQTTILSINQTPSDLTNDYQRLEGESSAAVMTKSASQV